MNPPASMIVIGVDPGSRITGYGVISVLGNHCSCVDYGAIRCRTRGLDGSFPDRLKTIHQGLSELFCHHAPVVVAVEEVFHAVNSRSALQLGHARGVVLLAAAQQEIPLVEYSPLEVKKAVSGYGRADKQQIQTMVRILLKLKDCPEPDDAADALAVALCHVFRGEFSQRPTRQNKVSC